MRFGRVAGISLYVHWSWFLVAAFAINRQHVYGSFIWNAVEYLALFGIVLLHELGHSLACRSTGGKADTIVLWPLGGVAYVNPPQRPGATLWSIAAGPLVNVVLFFVLTGLTVLTGSTGPMKALSDPQRCLRTVAYINMGLFLFNVLPVYPLDGGQILRSLLWFVLGRGRSLLVASVIGFIGVAGLLLLALLSKSIWLGILSAFILMNCWQGLRQSWLLMRLAKLPRHAEGFACPSCRTAPPKGPYWVCGQCRQAFDTFDAMATCPSCGAQYPETVCFDCGEQHPVSAWVPELAVVPPPPLPR